MSDNSHQNTEDIQIDLTKISKKIGNFFENIPAAIFRGFLFLRRNVLVIGILILLGIGMGFYLDRTSKSYMSEIIVAPNFESTDYLYSRINLLQSKINENDTVFLKQVVGINPSKKIIKISIKPIIDVYKFILKEDKNFEIVKLMAENGDINKIVKDEVTTKNYPFHTITFETQNKVDYKTIILPILNYLNNSEYYEKMQKIFVNNVNRKIAQNDSIISQIDGLLNTFSNTSTGSQRSEKLVFYNENTQLNEVIKTKDKLNEEQGELKLELANYDKIVKDVNTSLNIRNITGTKNKMKLILPLLFIFLFVFAEAVRQFYKREMAKLNK